MTVELKKEEIHLFIFTLNQNAIIVESMMKILNEAETEKVLRMKFVKDQNRVIQSIGNLKIILSRYMNCKPEEIILSANKFGKPEIVSESRLKFNYSHSGEMIVYAFNMDSDIGIDLEKIVTVPDIDQLAMQIFSSREIILLKSIHNETDKLTFFYQVWTRKEALLKAIGTGLTNDLREITVLDKITDLVHSPNYIRFDDKKWFVNELKLPTGYIGNVVYRSDFPKTVICKTPPKNN